MTDAHLFEEQRKPDDVDDRALREAAGSGAPAQADHGVTHVDSKRLSSTA